MNLTFRFLAITLFLVPGMLTAQQDTAKKEEFKPNGKVWGYAFGDYYYKMHADSLGRGNSQYSGLPETSNTFEMRRVYLGYDYNISERFSSEVLLSYEGNTLSDNATRTVFVKSANLRWKKLFCGTDVVFGLQATPAFPMLVEKTWGYRAAEKTIFDMRRLGGSADLGIGLQGRYGEKDKFGYNLLVANGSGTKLEGDIFKKVYGDVFVKLMDNKLILDAYGDYERTLMIPGLHKYKASFKFAAMYTTEPLTVGVEACIQQQHNYAVYTVPLTAVTDTSDVEDMGVSVFIHGSIIKGKLGFFARYDMFNPDLKYHPEDLYTAGGAPNTEMFILAGLDYTPHKNVHIMPNVWYDSFSNRSQNVSGHVRSDFDLVPRLTVWYVFK